MIKFLINIDLKRHVKFHENAIKSIATSVFPCLAVIPGLLYSCIFNILDILGVNFTMSYNRRKTAEN